MNNITGAANVTNFLSTKTIHDVDEYLKLDIQGQTLRDKKPWSSLSSGSAQGNIHAYNDKTIPKFAVDGYGRWRQIGVDNRRSVNDEFFNQKFIRPQRNLPESHKRFGKNDRELSRTSSRTMSANFLNEVGSRGRLNDSAELNESKALENDSKTTSRMRTGTDQGYRHLSMSLRSNVFPGVGKEKWESSTKQTFIPKPLPDRNDTETEFCIKKDSFMEWSEYDVYRQRLMKAWDKYITDMPKKEFTAPAPVVKQEKPKEVPQAKTTKKKTNNKQKERKETGKEIDNKNDEPKLQDPRPMRIEVKPAPSEDGFWDFYEKPFAQE